MNRADPLYTVLILYTPIIPGVNLHFSADPSVSTPIRDSNIASLTLYQSIIYLEVSFRIPIFVGTSLSLTFQIHSIPSSVPVRSIPFSHFSLEFHQKVYFIFYGRFFIRSLRGPLVITFGNNDSNQFSNSIRHLFAGRHRLNLLSLRESVSPVILLYKLAFNVLHSIIARSFTYTIILLQFAIAH